ncbi:MAG: hypothetical protein R3264_17850, partial [Anaerolineae bacterium]|nr:hypothetical protein [Anaerolineae bacterium]
MKPFTTQANKVASYGVLLGLLLLITVVTTAVLLEPALSKAEALQNIIQTNSLFWAIVSLPIVMGGCGYFIGKYQDHLLKIVEDKEHQFWSQTEELQQIIVETQTLYHVTQAFVSSTNIPDMLQMV